MKKINEGLKIDCSQLSTYPGMEGRMNELRDSIESLGANVTGDGADMYVDWVELDDLSDMLYFDYNLELSDLMNDEVISVYNDEILESKKSVNESYWDDDYCDSDDCYDWTDEDDLNMEIINSGRRGRVTVSDEEMFDDLDECNTIDEDEFDTDEALYDDDIFDGDVDVESYDDIESGDEWIDDEYMAYDDEDEYYTEDEEFDECLHESVKNKRKGCCPPTKSKRLVNLHESLSRRPKAKKRESFAINEAIFTKAIKKVKAANKKVVLEGIKSKLGSANYNNIVNALKEGKSSLYTKKRINGKNISEYSTKELYKLLKEVTEQIKKLSGKAKSLNESVAKSKAKEDLKLKKRLFKILDEELTYRLTVTKYLNEDEETTSTEETTTTSTEETTEETSDESTEETDNSDPEKDEEVELARVIITVANQAAADDLKSELVNAGVPDDAIEFETDDEDEDIEETSDEDTEDSSDDSESTEETDDTADTNESLHVNVFKRLLEDEETDTAEESTDDTDASAEDTEETSDDSADDKPVKVILVNTDYIETLAQVLNDVYGIEQDEFEEMIGGSIVSTDEDSDNSEDDSEETSDDSADDETSSHGDDAIDNMSDDDLAQLFGESATNKE